MKRNSTIYVCTSYFPAIRNRSPKFLVVFSETKFRRGRRSAVFRFSALVPEPQIPRIYFAFYAASFFFVLFFTPLYLPSLAVRFIPATRYADLRFLNATPTINAARLFFLSFPEFPSLPPSYLPVG